MTPPDQPDEQPSALSRLERALAGFGEPARAPGPAPDDTVEDQGEAEGPESEPEALAGPEPEEDEPQLEEDDADDEAGDEADDWEPAPAESSSPLDIAAAVEAVERLTAVRESKDSPSDRLNISSPDADADARVLATAARGDLDDDEPRFRPADLRARGRELDRDEDFEAEVGHAEVGSLRGSDAAESWQRNVGDPALPYFLVEDHVPTTIASSPTLEELRHAPEAQAKPATSIVRTLAEIPILLIVAALIAFLVKTFLAQAYYIPSGSMLPQLQIDDRVAVSKLAYKAHDPRRGDIIVFDDPTPGAARSGDESILKKIGEGIGIVQPSTDEFIKRVVGLPGETVEGHDGHVYINGRQLIEPYLKPDVVTSDFDKIKVRPGRLWVMGDNRSGSADSRFFGQVRVDTIVGRAVVKLWPADHISFL